MNKMHNTVLHTEAKDLQLRHIGPQLIWGFENLGIFIYQNNYICLTHH